MAEYAKSERVKQLILKEHMEKCKRAAECGLDMDIVIKIFNEVDTAYIMELYANRENV